MSKFDFDPDKIIEEAKSNLHFNRDRQKVVAWFKGSNSKLRLFACSPLTCSHAGRITRPNTHTAKFNARCRETAKLNTQLEAEFGQAVKSKLLVYFKGAGASAHGDKINPSRPWEICVHILLRGKRAFRNG